MIKVGSAIIEHADQLERERGIPKDVIISALKEAMLAAYKRYAKLETLHCMDCQLNERTGEIGIYEMRKVVNRITPEEDWEMDELGNLIPADLEILLEDARKIKPDVELDQVLEIEVTPTEFGRIAAQSAKQVIMQRIREAEKMLVQKEFQEKQGMVTTAIVQRIEGRNVIVNIGKSEAVLPPKEQLPSEYYRVGNKLRVYVLGLKDSGRVPQIIVSQAHPAMVREVFELEVPEIEDGLVAIKSIAREAGYRTKVAVVSLDPDVDAAGACIGSRGSRIQAIVNELKNEKIDIIRWSENPMEFIVNALAPAKIIQVFLIHIDAHQVKSVVVVPDDQLSLAIGREGQNVRLAAKLTGFKLDIKSITKVEEEGGLAYFEELASRVPELPPEEQQPMVDEDGNPLPQEPSSEMDEDGNPLPQEPSAEMDENGNPLPQELSSEADESNMETTAVSENSAAISPEGVFSEADSLENEDATADHASEEMNAPADELAEPDLDGVHGDDQGADFQDAVDAVDSPEDSSTEDATHADESAENTEDAAVTLDDQAAMQSEDRLVTEETENQADAAEEVEKTPAVE
ncbi:MAG: transcription termination factor NusA [Cyanobacteria bacterium P01_H01_bin.74]